MTNVQKTALLSAATTQAKDRATRERRLMRVWFDGERAYVRSFDEGRPILNFGAQLHATVYPEI